MNFDTFCEVVDKIRKKNPILFELSSSYHPTDNDFYIIQRDYDILLPDEYKMFYKKYCGGYFGFTKLFSYDKNEDLYILRHNSIDFVNESGFFAISDLETGDYIGYKVRNGMCSSHLYYYNHELCTTCNSKYTGLLDYILKEGLHYYE